MKITVLSPHLDDASFSVGLAVEVWIDGGHAVEVINCFTRSEYCPFGDLDFIHANDRRSYVTALRRREDSRWSRMYRNPLMLRDLNLKDAPLRLGCNVEDVCTVSVRPGEKAMDKIRRSLEESVTGALLLPLAVGGHVDHRTAHEAGQGGLPETMPVAYYEDLPYAARAGGQEQVLECVAAMGGWLQPCFAAEAVDVKAAVVRKRQLALCYNSQINDETAEQIARFSERFDGRERLWGNQAWLAMDWERGVDGA